MRIGIISDIHGNATALGEVLKDIEENGIDRIFSLGDNIGYGPEPETVVQMLKDHNIPSVVGNHEMAVNNSAYLEWFNPTARLSLEKTVGMLSRSTIDYIAGFPKFRTLNDCRFVHGFPPDSPTLYLFEMSNQEIRSIMEELPERICFIGHTHELVLLQFDGRTVSRTPLRQQTIKLSPERKYIVNVGSVGQPRDGNKNAKYVIWDTVENKLEVRFIPYNVTETVSKIFQAGLPEQHAWRLM